MPSRMRCTRKVKEVRPLGLVELKRARKRFKDAFGDTGYIAALKPDVVIDADPGDERDFLSPESRDAAACAIPGQPGLVWLDPRSSGGEELSNLAPYVHASQHSPAAPTVGGSISTRINEDSQSAQSVWFSRDVPPGARRIS